MNDVQRIYLKLSEPGVKEAAGIVEAVRRVMAMPTDHDSSIVLAAAMQLERTHYNSDSTRDMATAFVRYLRVQALRATTKG
jgi:hypothetical protein